MPYVASEVRNARNKFEKRPGWGREEEKWEWVEEEWVEEEWVEEEWGRTDRRGKEGIRSRGHVK